MGCIWEPYLSTGNLYDVKLDFAIKISCGNGIFHSLSKIISIPTTLTVTLPDHPLNVVIGHNVLT